MAKKELAVIAPQQTNAIQAWVEGEVFEKLSTLANKFAQSQLVPQNFRGKPHDCFIAMQIAHRMQTDPFLVLQNLKVINGTPTWAAVFAIARANELGPFADRISFEAKGEGESLSVTASAKHETTGKIVSATVDMKMAKAEGWTKNSKYQTMPEQMLCYRAAMFLIRRHCPEILQGMPTTDEIEDISAARNVTPTTIDGTASNEAASSASKVQDLNRQIEESI